MALCPEPESGTRTASPGRTVSTARRFGLFELKLDPKDPTRYIHDGVSTPMTRTEVTVEVKDAAPVTHTFYASRFGPILETDTFAWDRERAFALRHTPQGVRTIDQYIAIWKSKSVRELRDALARHQATGFNTTAVDKSGEAFYGDMGLVPNVTPELAEACSVSELAKTQWKEQRIPVLDGRAAPAIGGRMLTRRRRACSAAARRRSCCAPTM